MTASAEMQARNLGSQEREILLSGGLSGGGVIEQAPENKFLLFSSLSAYFSPFSLTDSQAEQGSVCLVLPRLRSRSVQGTVGEGA